MRSPIVFRNPFTRAAANTPGRSFLQGLASMRLTRAWKGAKQDRLTADWLSSGADINKELKSQLAILRTRARELEQNNNVARRFLKLLESNVVGPDGFTLQVMAKDSKGALDEKSNAVEDDFKRWARLGICELTGKYTLASLERLLVRTTGRDGELLLRMHDVQPSKRNPWGFVVEALDPARLDHRLNTDLSNGNRVRLGIELNKAGRPVAYYLRRGNSALEVDSHERVPADDIIHWFPSDRPEQLRGVPMMASAMLTMHMLEAYQDTAMVASRAGASKMGWVKTSKSAHVLADDQDAVTGELYEDLEPGVIGQLGVDDDFIGFDPKYPHELYAEFVKTCLREIASGLNVSYHAISGDLSDVNYSSLREGALVEREEWKVLQNNFAGAVLERIYERWLSNAALNNRNKLVGVSQEEFLNRFSAHRWQGRRWSWVDPLKDIKATVEAINAGLTSPQRVAAEMGVDVNVVLEQIASFQKSLGEKKVTLPVYSKTPDINADAGDEQNNGGNKNAA